MMLGCMRLQTSLNELEMEVVISIDDGQGNSDDDFVEVQVYLKLRECIFFSVGLLLSLNVGF